MVLMFVLLKSTLEMILIILIMSISTGNEKTSIVLVASSWSSLKTTLGDFYFGKSRINIFLPRM